MTYSTTIPTRAARVAAPWTRSIRVRLACGIVAGPLYLVVSYAQALTRPGFDLTRNAFSYLSLGSLGGLQVANFVACGLLFVVSATGMRRVLRVGPGARCAPWLIATMGGAMIAGGVFVIDPAFGYPEGAPVGMPQALSWHGILHAIAFAVAFLSWIVAAFVFAGRFSALKRRGWAAYSTAVGLVLLAPIATFVAPPGAAVIYAAATFGWTWTSAVTAHLLRETPNPRTTSGPD